MMQSEIMMRVALLAFFALPAAAAPPVADCDLVEGEMHSCSRVLACIGEDGTWFDGRAVGWDQGLVTGRLDDGRSCGGVWYYTEDDRARAELVCEDGAWIGVDYTAQDGATGTGIGTGTTSDGRAVEAWTGENVLDYLSEDRGRPVLPCGVMGIPIS